MENGVIDYDFPTFDDNNMVNFGPLTKKTLTLKFNRVPEVVEIYVHTKFHQGMCSG